MKPRKLSEQNSPASSRLGRAQRAKEVPPSAAKVLPLHTPRLSAPPTSPSGLADSFVTELVEAFLRLAVTNPTLVARVRDALGGDGSSFRSDPLLMRKTEYAERIGYGVRTLDKLIAAGLPTRGQGKLLRIVVADADNWLLSQDAGDLDDVDLLALANARKAGRDRE